jgi:hypothetical protein
MAEKTFADGLVAKYPHAKAPDFVVAHLSIKAKELIAFIEKHQKPDGWLNLDLLKSKDGQKMYAVLNEWKPEQKAEASPSVLPNYTEEEINPDDIPF